MWIDPSIGIMEELNSLIQICKNIHLELNIIFGLNSLVVLDLLGYSKLFNNHPLQLEVDENRSSIELSASFIYEMLILPFYFFSSWKHEDSLGWLASYFSRSPCLYHLDLSFCNLLQIPDAIENLHSLVDLNFFQLIIERD